MRPLSTLALGLAVTASVAGCTFLVSFDDIPDAGSGLGVDNVDSGFSSTSSSSSSGATTSSSSSSSSTGGIDSGAAPFPPACDTTNLAQVDCGGNNVPICAVNLPSVPPNVTATDLVECGLDGRPTCIRHCTMGCVDTPGNLPSQCANCTNKTAPDQWYCGKNSTWDPADNDVAYECKSGKYVGGADSVANCGQGFCHTTCTRTNLAKLPGSCCQDTPDN